MNDPYSLNVNDPNLVNFDTEKLPVYWLPEPSACALLALGLLAFVILVRRQHRRRSSRR